MAARRRHSVWMFRFLICGVLGFGPYGLANAAMVDTQSAIDTAAVKETRERVNAMLQRPGVAEELKTLGASPAEAQARVDAMTDDEVRTLAGKIGDLPAGGRISNNELILLLVIILILVL